MNVFMKGVNWAFKRERLEGYAFWRSAEAITTYGYRKLKKKKKSSTTSKSKSKSRSKSRKRAV